MTTVLCAIYGDYDPPPLHPPQTVGADWILITDRPIDAPGWRVVVEPRPHMHPCLAAKIPKCLPSLYTNDHTTIWLDGSCWLLRPDSLEQIIDGAQGAPMAQIGHPDRDCIYDEAAFCAPIPKYAGLPMQAQVDHYRTLGHPAHAGLWATGLIVRNGWLPGFGHQWLTEQVRWGYQDQLSHPPLAARFGMHTLPFPLVGSGLFEWRAGHH